MTPDEIIAAAREAGMLVHIPFPSDTEVGISIERFAQLVRAAALEESAGICEEMFSCGALEVAAAIRQLKEQA